MITAQVVSHQHQQAYSRLKIMPKLLMDLFLFLSVDDGSIIDVNFTDLVYHAPEGFQKIMFEKNLL